MRLDHSVAAHRIASRAAGDVVVSHDPTLVDWFERARIRESWNACEHRVACALEYWRRNMELTEARVSGGGGADWSDIFTIAADDLTTDTVVAWLQAKSVTLSAADFSFAAMPTTHETKRVDDDGNETVEEVESTHAYLVSRFAAPLLRKLYKPIEGFKLSITGRVNVDGAPGIRYSLIPVDAVDPNAEEGEDA